MAACWPTLWLAVLPLALAACAPEPQPAHPAPQVADPVRGADSLGVPARLGARLGAAKVRVLDRVGDAYALVVLPTEAGDVLVQWADLDQVDVTQILGPQVEGVRTAGAFHPTAPSPRFETLAPDSVVGQADGATLAVTNGAFFETPGRASTQIAFPISQGGAVMTGGSSPYGPGRDGAEAARWGRPLRTLGFGDGVVRVAEYVPASGAPLADALFADALVSYAPDAHPTRIATRFHLVGPVHADSTGASSELILATGLFLTIDQLSAVVARLGVAAEHQVALDGGASVLVWTRGAGTLQRPTEVAARGAGGQSPQPLPHYLRLRLRDAR